ncbi:hypothetical protein MC7420_4037 [Coleofasciculus chthonoplastes PCC 7420]|uniref:Uncharacterized protein n=1 Tax=Coleofasciculus chthonoplastes PCC 7420 TaxID=118168 RepID=B4VUT8_9CYAN|nr:hypothetical protein MC7420_4037 [Coleofasciculus chthonoplastes PCC 7420]
MPNKIRILVNYFFLCFFIIEAFIVYLLVVYHDYSRRLE